MFIKAKKDSSLCCRLKWFLFSFPQSPSTGQQGRAFECLFLHVSCRQRVSDSFLCLRRALYSLLIISKLEAAVVSLHDCISRDWKDWALFSHKRLTHMQTLPSGAKCHYINRSQKALIYRYLYAASVWMFEFLLPQQNMNDRGMSLVNWRQQRGSEWERGVSI